MADKKFIAYYDFDCEHCDSTISKDDEFHFFNGDKICEDCWQKLVDYYEDEM
jgi:hypothetical protein